MVVSAIKKPATKRKKTSTKTQTSQAQNTVVNETVADITIQPTARTLKKRSYDITNNLNEFLRNMDADIIQLLSIDLQLKMPLSEEEIGECIGLLEFK